MLGRRDRSRSHFLRWPAREASGTASLGEVAAGAVTAGDDAADEADSTTAPTDALLGPGQIDTARFAPPVRSATQTQINPPPAAPLPDALPPNSGIGRRAVYSKSQQRVWAVDANGAVIKTHLVSGRLAHCDPRPGTYSVYSRSLHTFATHNPSLVWRYMVRFAKGCRGGNIGFHEIPTDRRTGNPVQSVSQLGTALSGGCVRQAESDAVWMWNWAQLGTKVVVLP